MGVGDWTRVRRDSVNLEDASIETSKTEMQREREKKKGMKKTKYSRTIGQFTESVTCMLKEY